MLAPQPVTPEACPFCLHCGHNQIAERTIERGRFRYDPRAGFFVDGERLRASPSIHSLLGSLMQANGRIVPREILGERIGSEVSDPRRVLDVYLCRARAAFRALGIGCPIDNVWGTGLRWSAEDPSPAGASAT